MRELFWGGSGTGHSNSKGVILAEGKSSKINPNQPFFPLLFSR